MTLTTFIKEAREFKPKIWSIIEAIRYVNGKFTEQYKHHSVSSFYDFNGISIEDCRTQSTLLDRALKIIEAQEKALGFYRRVGIGSQSADEAQAEIERILNENKGDGK